MAEKKPALTKKKKEDVVMPQEEDLFEEFALGDETVGGPEALEVQQEKKEAELPLWTADWFDEDVGGDFTEMLKTELSRAAK